MQSLKILATVLGLIATFVSVTARSEIVEVNISADIVPSDFTIGTDSVFGVSPSTLTFTMTVEVDTSTEVDMVSMGPDYSHDIWGYNAVTSMATFGDKTWTNFLMGLFGDGIEPSRLYVGTQLAPGVLVDRIALRMQDGDGFLIVGSRSCGQTCQLAPVSQSSVHIRDFNGGPLGDTNDFVFTGTYSVSVAGSTDTDGDGVNNASDNCTNLANPDQRDTNGDGIGNLCDPDVINDCLANFLDLQVYKDNFFASGDLDTDNNGDNVTNFLDLNVLKEFFFAPPGPSATGCN